MAQDKLQFYAIFLAAILDFSGGTKDIHIINWFSFLYVSTFVQIVLR